MHVAMSAWGMYLVVLMSGGLGLPVGLPPGPEDHTLAAVAPEECLFYTSWPGTAKPDPTSKNQTEQMLAEPEIQEFLVRVEREIRAGLHRSAEREGPQAMDLADDAVTWVRLLLTRPTAAFVSDVKLGPQGPDVRGGLVVRLGDDLAKVRTSLEKHQQLLPKGMVQPVQIGEQAWYRVKLQRGAPEITWGTKGKYLVVGVGEDGVESILKRAGGEPPKWLSDLRKQLPLPRTSSVSYLNVKGIVERAAPLAGPRLPAALEALGLQNVTTIAGVSGLDDTGFVSTMLIGVDGPSSGLLALSTAEPLGPKDLAPIPRDATLALAVRVDPDRLFDAIRSVVAKLDARAAQEFDAELGRIEEDLEIKLRDDLLKPLGDTWCVYNSPGEGGLVVTGLTAVAKLRDPERAAKTHAKLLAKFRGMLHPQQRGGGRPTEIVQFEFGGRQVYYLSVGERDFPLAPAWCFTDKELIVSLFPQNIKAYLSRGSDYLSLAEVPEAAAALQGAGTTAALAGAPGPFKLFYQNTPALVELAYPFLQIGAKSLVQELQRERINVDLSILPSAPSIRRHVRPGVTTARRTSAGIEVTTRQSLPGGNLGAAIPVAVGLALPAVQSARSAAQRSQSMNNVKQIGLAMHNHHDAYKRLPAAYIADKEGKPLLSWRVAILPFIEQQALYEQFHRDEPWDSEHNKKLLAQMPTTYRAPGSKAPPGKTTYLTARGKDTVFPGKEALSFAHVLDGTSNTIMVVEASDRMAVEWTRPDDLPYDPQAPSKGLFGAMPGGTVVLFCDGSVRFIAQSISAEVLDRLFNRHDGKPVERF